MRSKYEEIVSSKILMDLNFFTFTLLLYFLNFLYKKHSSQIFSVNLSGTKINFFFSSSIFNDRIPIFNIFISLCHILSPNKLSLSMMRRSMDYHLKKFSNTYIVHCNTCFDTINFKFLCRNLISDFFSSFN